VSPSGIVSAPTLRGYPGLQTDRYNEEFLELGTVGKGGYGKVYKAKHKLDGSLYAVKRIPVSSTKMAKVQEHGPEELESLLREVRSLARFDHANVIRYHNAWLEFTTTPTSEAVPTTTMLRTDRLLEDAATLGLSPEDTEEIQAQLDEMSFGDLFEKSNGSHGAGIVFGTDHTENSEDEVYQQPVVTQRHNIRRGSQASQATVATISSTKSRMSAVQDADEGEDADVEMIPRSHVPNAQESTTEASEDMVSHSDVSGPLVPIRSSGPILMLNVQMSLCETNLAALLSAEQLLSPLYFARVTVPHRLWSRVPTRTGRRSSRPETRQRLPIAFKRASPPVWLNGSSHLQGLSRKRLSTYNASHRRLRTRSCAGRPVHGRRHVFETRRH
jgi:translation initiation factor 2-alpha kinase 3